MRHTSEFDFNTTSNFYALGSDALPITATTWTVVLSLAINRNFIIGRAQGVMNENLQGISYSTPKRYYSSSSEINDTFRTVSIILSL